MEKLRLTWLPAIILKTTDKWLKPRLNKDFCKPAVYRFKMTGPIICPGPSTHRIPCTIQLQTWPCNSAYSIISHLCSCGTPTSQIPWLLMNGSDTVSRSGRVHVYVGGMWHTPTSIWLTTTKAKLQNTALVIGWGSLYGIFVLCLAAPNIMPTASACTQSWNKSTQKPAK